MKEIRFYEAENPYGYFSNFALYPLVLNGKIWPTSEHYYQAQKVAGTAWEEKIRLCATPQEAFDMTRLPEFPERADWVNVKDDAMYDAVYAKFTQHADLRRKLLDSGEAVLDRRFARGLLLGLRHGWYWQEHVGKDIDGDQKNAG